MEVYYPATGQTCSLPNLLTPIADHTLDNIQGSLYSCGGNDASQLRRCQVLRPGAGEWTQYGVTLSRKREDHISWVPVTRPSQIFLLGGAYSHTTVEVVDTATTSVKALPHTLSPGRGWSCGIDLGDMLVLTGGMYDRYNTLTSVIR